LFSEKRDCLVACCVPVKDLEIGAAEFKTIKDVLSALKSIDARVEDVLLGKPSSLAMHYEGEVGLELNREGFFRVVRLGLFGNWHEMLEKVDRFLSDNGKRPSTTAKNPEEKRLGQWLAVTLTAQRKGKLVADRMEAF
jgi:hypothetical protein